jgi:acetyl esterase/lipase
VAVADTMIKLLQLFGILILVAGLAYKFAALKIFDFVVPKDPGVDLVLRDIPYGSDPRQRLDIYRPIGQAQLPILVFVHGGGWDSGDKGEYGFAAKAFAAQGYAAVVINYRLVPQHLYPAFVDDVALAIAKVEAVALQVNADPLRIYLVGHSAGGYNMLQAVLDPHYLAAAHVNPQSIRAVAALAAPADFLPLDSPKSIAAFSKASPLQDTQPIQHVRADAPPILLLHGSEDTTVGPHNSKNLAAKLSSAGADVQHKEYSGVGHVKIMLAIAKPLQGQVPVLADITRFFAAHK